MTADDTEDLGADTVRGGEGLATGAGPDGDTETPAPDVAGSPRGGEGLATSGTAPQEGLEDAPEPDESVQDTARGGEGLAGA